MYTQLCLVNKNKLTQGWLQKRALIEKLFTKDFKGRLQIKESDAEVAMASHQKDIERL